MTKNRATILFAEDDNSLAFIIKDALEEEGFKVIHCADGQQAIDIFDKNKFDICLLDIMMPFKDGYTVAKKIRQQSDIMPIIFLSTKSNETDKIKGYDTGADDYLSKPFSMAELLKKIDVFLRRSKKINPENEEVIQLRNIKFIPSEMQLITQGNLIRITPKEAEILLFLSAHKNKILQRQDVLLHVWGKDDYFLGRSLDVFISKLRKYLKEDPSIILETIHRVGFRLIIPA